MSILTKVYTTTKTHHGINGPFETPDYSGPSAIEYTFVGATLCDREENYYDDSDGYSHVYNAETGTIQRVGTWTTRCGHNNAGVKVDAYSNENAEAVESMRQAHIKALSPIAFMLMERDFRSAEFAAKSPSKGDTVKVVSGRKVAKGTTGEVIWVGERSYSYYSKETRIGIKDASGEVHWTAASNVEVVNPVMPDPDDFFRMDSMLKSWSAMDLKTLHANLCSAQSSMLGLARI